MKCKAAQLFLSAVFLLLAFTASASLTEPELPDFQDTDVAQSAAAAEPVDWAALEAENAVLAVLLVPFNDPGNAYIALIPCDPQNRYYRLFRDLQPPLGLSDQDIGVVPYVSDVGAQAGGMAKGAFWNLPKGIIGFVGDMGLAVYVMHVEFGGNITGQREGALDHVHSVLTKFDDWKLRGTPLTSSPVSAEKSPLRVTGEVAVAPVVLVAGGAFEHARLSLEGKHFEGGQRGGEALGGAFLLLAPFAKATPKTQGSAVPAEFFQRARIEVRALMEQGLTRSEAFQQIRSFNSGQSGGYVFHFTEPAAGQSIVSGAFVEPSSSGVAGPGVYAGTTPTPSLFLKHTPFVGWGVDPPALVRIPILLKPQFTLQRPFLPPKTIVIKHGVPLKP